MLRRSVLVMAVAMASAALAGCGNSAGLFPVSGKVVYRGEPAAGAVVYFHRQMEPGSPSESIPYGIVEDDGSFLLTSDDIGNGARPGSYIVLVEWRDGSGDRVDVPTVQGQGQAGEAGSPPIGHRSAQGPLFRHQQAPAPHRSEGGVESAGSF